MVTQVTISKFEFWDSQQDLNETESFKSLYEQNKE